MCTYRMSGSRHAVFRNSQRISLHQDIQESKRNVGHEHDDQTGPIATVRGACVPAVVSIPAELIICIIGNCVDIRATLSPNQTHEFSQSASEYQVSGVYYFLFLNAGQLIKTMPTAR